MLIDRKRFLLILALSMAIGLAQVLPSALNAVNLAANSYSVASKQDQECQGTVNGELTLDYQGHLYSFTAPDSGGTENPDDIFHFTCGKLEFEGSLSGLGSGTIQNDGKVDFACAVLTPKPEISVWPVSCQW